jgi:hypothetical protein
MLKEWPWFIGLPIWAKWTGTLLVCVLMPIISQVIQEFLPASAWTFLEHWWPFVAIGMGVWVASQVWNQVFNKKVDRQYSVFEDVSGNKPAKKVVTKAANKG